LNTDVMLTDMTLERERRKEEREEERREMKEEKKGRGKDQRGWVDSTQVSGKWQRSRRKQLGDRLALCSDRFLRFCV